MAKYRPKWNKSQHLNICFFSFIADTCSNTNRASLLSRLIIRSCFGNVICELLCQHKAMWIETESSSEKHPMRHKEKHELPLGYATHLLANPQHYHCRSTFSTPKSSPNVLLCTWWSCFFLLINTDTSPQPFIHCAYMHNPSACVATKIAQIVVQLK